MAYQTCAGKIAASIQIDCNNPIAGELTGRAVIFELGVGATFTKNSTNPLKIEAVTPMTDRKFIAVENFGEQPFNGTNSASSADGAVRRHTKTFTFDVPVRGADASRNIIDPLTRQPLGFGAIYERKDGRYIVLGVEQGLRVNADGVSSDEYTKDGATTITASCQQYNYEYELVNSDEPAVSLFETYLSNTY